MPDDLAEPLEVTHPGAYSVGEITWGGGRLVLVSLYALSDYSGERRGGKPVYSETSLHRTLSDLTPIIDVRRNRSSVLLGGDFNASTQFPEPFRSAYRVVHERLATLGLVNVSSRRHGDGVPGCPCIDEPCTHVQTIEGPTPYQDDYLYASPDVTNAVTDMQVARSDALEAVSDHMPLVLDVEPPSPPV